MLMHFRHDLTKCPQSQDPLNDLGASADEFTSKNNSLLNSTFDAGAVDEQVPSRNGTEPEQADLSAKGKRIC